jgi:hypothetical protein
MNFVKGRGTAFRHLAVVVALAGAPLRAEVVRLEVLRREPFAAGHTFGRSGPYERLIGTLHFEVDPALAANRRITDLALAPRNGRGRVELAADFFLLKPADPGRGNRRLIYDVNNRGNKLILGAFNDRGGNHPASLEDAGNGFLLRQGYSVLWCGWNGDVRPGDGRLLIQLPVAQKQGPQGPEPITGRIYAEVCVNATSLSEPLAWGNSTPYAAVPADSSDTRLTARPLRSAPAEEVPRSEWAFARVVDGKPVPDPTHLYLKDGFKPGWLYEVVYSTRDPRVTGLGFAAVRDAVAFFRYAAADGVGSSNPLAGAIERAYGFGISQSARFLTHLLLEGFHVDEAGRAVFDALMPHVGGGGKGLFNGRFVQTTRHGSQHEDNLYPSDFFPFTTVPQRDPASGEEGSLLDRARALGHVPRVFFTETSTEYWSRAGSLLHTDVEGKVDVAPAPEVRMYFFAGAQHGVSARSDRGIYQHPVNTLDHRPLLRALLVALDEWVTAGREPPPSRFPRIADGTLVDIERFRASFPALPGVEAPRVLFTPRRLDLGPRWRTEGIANNVPPLVGEPYRTLVPAVDADGNERAGVRLPELAVPLATYAGWNLRGAASGAEGMLSRWTGVELALPRDEAERRQRGDPRRSVRERYPSREAYVARILEAVLALERERFLLAEDVVAITRRAGERAELWAD